LNQNITVHKSNPSDTPPLVSLVLLDWSCREQFHTLDWLNRQNVDRNRYEIIWVELYDRVVDVALDKSDTMITCGQRGLYHKHLGYNIGLLHSRGKLVTVCDSDAVFPGNFIQSLLSSFELDNGHAQPKSLVLMHYEWRSPALYPDELVRTEQLDDYPWADLWPNVGACMTVPREDAFRFGGFDEHRSYRGYMCGPYDLGWRMVNAGIPEVWHDPSVALWHFSHPDPPATYHQKFSWEMAREKAYPHIDGHALTAVEAFTSGRLLPKKENPEIFRIRMQGRRVGTSFEEQYAHPINSRGLSRWRRFILHGKFWSEVWLTALQWKLMPRVLSWFGETSYLQVRNAYRRMRGRPPVGPEYLDKYR